MSFATTCLALDADVVTAVERGAMDFMAKLLCCHTRQRRKHDSRVDGGRFDDAGRRSTNEIRGDLRYDAGWCLRRQRRRVRSRLVTSGSP